MVQAEPPSSEDLLAGDVTVFADSHRRLGGVGCFSNLLSRVLSLCGPPGRLLQICLLEADAPDCDGVGPCGRNLLFFPHVGDVEVPKDRIRMRRLARIQRVGLACKIKSVCLVQLTQRTLFMTGLTSDHRHESLFLKCVFDGPSVAGCVGGIVHTNHALCLGALDATSTAEDLVSPDCEYG